MISPFWLISSPNYAHFPVAPAAPNGALGAGQAHRAGAQQQGDQAAARRGHGSAQQTQALDEETTEEVVTQEHQKGPWHGDWMWHYELVEGDVRREKRYTG